MPDELNYRTKYLEKLLNELKQNYSTSQIEVFQKQVAELSSDLQLEQTLKQTLKQTKYSGNYSDDGLQYLGYGIVSLGELKYNLLLNDPLALESYLDVASQDSSDEFEEFCYIFDITL